jgi:serine/threonine-protein kinase
VQAEQLLNNRYRVDGLLGNGGMALVYVGTDTLLRRRVAIKVLRDQYAADDDFVRRFSYEAQSAAKLSHPNIVNVYDFGRENDAYYIVMELVDGATLAELLREERVLPENVAIDYAIQIASGLAYAHRQELLHRDVKPANILITKDDVVKLSDFGIARAVSENSLGATQPGMVMGSVAYISPEQAQNHEIDERSDLYSVGVVLYQMLTGALPFTADTPVAVALKHVTEPAPQLEPDASGVSPAIAAIVSRLLRKNRHDRFASATELASALREARERPLVAHAASFGEPPAGRIPPGAPPPRPSLSPDRPPLTDGVGELIAEHEEPHRPDRRWIVWIVMPVLLLAAVLIGFFALRSDLFGPARNITLPSVEGQSSTVAQQTLFQLGLRPTVTEEASETVPVDHVIRQDPAAGTKLAKDAPVALVVSEGLPLVTVPNVKGFSAADAQRTLTDAKLRAKITQIYNATIPTGIVIDVNPGAGAQARQGSAIALSVSKGIAPVSVPSVINLTLEDARHALAAAHLSFTVTQTANDAIPADIVASQSPDPGAFAPPNSSVAIVVSTGPTSTEIPNVVGNDPDTAQATLTQAAFVPVLNYNVDAKGPPGKVAFQNPNAGSQAKKGSKVTIFVTVPGTVPDVAGMTLDDAKLALVAAGYKVGNIAYTPDATVAPGTVVRTEPEGSMRLNPGESVNLTVMQTAQ